MSGSHAAVSGRGITDQYTITSAEFAFDTGKGGIVYHRGYGGPNFFNFGSINKTRFNIKNEDVVTIRVSSDSSTYSTGNAELVMTFGNTTVGRTHTNNGWTKLIITHNFSGTVWTYKRSDFGYVTDGAVESLSASWGNDIGPASGSVPFKNITSGQNVYTVSFV